MEVAQAGLPLALPSPQERHGKLVSKCLPWMWSLTRQLIHLWQFPRSPLWMQAAGGSWFKGQAGQEEAREVWEVTVCHVGKQAPVRDEGARCGAGWEVPAPASLAVWWAFIPGKGVGFAWCRQRHKRLRRLGGTVQVLAMALSLLRGHVAGWRGQGGGDAGGPSLQDGFREAPKQTWRGCRKPALGARQSAAQPLCGHRGVCDTSSLGCFLVTGQLPTVPLLTRSQRCSWPPARFAHCLLRVMAAIQQLPGFRERER